MRLLRGRTQRSLLSAYLPPTGLPTASVPQKAPGSSPPSPTDGSETRRQAPILPLGKAACREAAAPGSWRGRTRPWAIPGGAAAHPSRPQPRPHLPRQPSCRLRHPRLHPPAAGSGRRGNASAKCLWGERRHRQTAPPGGGEVPSRALRLAALAAQRRRRRGAAPVAEFLS